MPSFYNTTSPDGIINQIDITTYANLRAAHEANLLNNTLVLINYYYDTTSTYAANRSIDHDFCISNLEYADIPYHLTLLRAMDGYLELLADLSPLEVTFQVAQTAANDTLGPRLENDTGTGNIQVFKIPKPWTSFDFINDNSTTQNSNGQLVIVNMDGADNGKLIFNIAPLIQFIKQDYTNLIGATNSALNELKNDIVELKTDWTDTADAFVNNLFFIDYDDTIKNNYQIYKFNPNDPENPILADSFALTDLLPETWQY